MSRALVVLDCPEAKARAAHWLNIAPSGTRLEFKKPTRSLPQNDKMWAMLTEIAAQKEWFGQKLTPDDWKHVFTAALRRELRMVPNLDGNAMVLLGQSTSDMTKEEMSDLIELMLAKGAEWEIVFSDPQEPANDTAEEAPAPAPSGFPETAEPVKSDPDPAILDQAASFKDRLAQLETDEEVVAAVTHAKTDKWFLELKAHDLAEAKAIMTAADERRAEIRAAG